MRKWASGPDPQGLRDVFVVTDRLGLTNSGRSQNSSAVSQNKDTRLIKPALP
jgi:hypothetical protein